MRKGEIVPFFFLFLFSTTLLTSQSLVELSKREKERRTILKGKSIKTVTNNDFAVLKKEPALTSQSVILKPETAIGKTDEAEKIYSELAGVQDARSEIYTEERPENRKFATNFFPSSVFVHDPEKAIGEPDGEFAEIEYWGWIDLEMEAKNGEGEDIAVHAKRSEGGIQDYRRMPYLVFVQQADKWIAIGQGGGVTSPERFDLGDVRSANMIRIMYRNLGQLCNNSRLLQPYDQRGYWMGIDAVRALH